MENGVAPKPADHRPSDRSNKTLNYRQLMSAMMLETLQENERRYRTLARVAPVGIFRTDTDGNCVYVNETWCEITGLSFVQLLAKCWARAVHPDDADRVLKEWNHTKKENLVFKSEFRILRPDGITVWVIGQAEAERELSGKVFGYVGAVTDITDRKDAEEHLRRSEEKLRQAQKMEAVGNLAGGIAHDFNNLLTIIMACNSMMLQELPEYHPLREDAEEIKKAGERAVALTRQLLAFSRKQVLKPKIFDLNAVVADMGRMLCRLIGQDIDLVAILNPTPGKVRADPGQIEQVIMNLVVNARDAMPRGGKLVIETADFTLNEAQALEHGSIKPGSYVVLAVSDTGCGMDQETQAHIFEPFFTTKVKSDGTGLGLSTVDGIIHQSGGYVSVYSELGRGTTFKIYLPQVEDLREDLKTGGKLTELSGSETILLVEDEDSVRRATRKILEKYGYRVLEARHGGEAWSVCQRYKSSIQLLISDVVMPGVSGPDLAKTLRAFKPDMKVLFISGYTAGALTQQRLLEPGTNFLSKPFEPWTLAYKVREVLRSSELQATRR